LSGSKELGFQLVYQDHNWSGTVFHQIRELNFNYTNGNNNYLQAGKTLEEDVVHNDFKREMMFYRWVTLM